MLAGGGRGHERAIRVGRARKVGFGVSAIWFGNSKWIGERRGEGVQRTMGFS